MQSNIKTSVMKQVVLPAFAMASLFAASSQAAEPTTDDFYFTGYARAGTSANPSGGSGASYSSNAIGRLGNENDAYFEMAFGKKMEVNGVKYEFATMFAYWGNNPNQEVQYGNGKDGTGQAYVEQVYGKVDYSSYAIWAGKRYYKRADIHILDWYYNKNVGTGFGVEDVDLSFAKLSLAYFQQLNNTNSTNIADPEGNWDSGSTKSDVYSGRVVNIYDFRLNEIGVGVGALNLALFYAQPSLTDGQTSWVNGSGSGSQHNLKLAKEAGTLTTIEHKFEFGEGNQNIAVFQYGSNGYLDNGGKAAEGVASIGDMGMTAGYYGVAEGSAYRFIDHGVLSGGNLWDLGYAFTYNYVDVKDQINQNENLRAQTSANLVIRPSYKWNDTMKTTFEAGYFVKDISYTKGKSATAKVADKDFNTNLGKFTIAQEWYAGEGFWARPAVRIFATQYFGDEVAYREGCSSTNNSNCNVNGVSTGNKYSTTIGGQFEAWW